MKFRAAISLLAEETFHATTHRRGVVYAHVVIFAADWFLDERLVQLTSVEHDGIFLFLERFAGFAESERRWLLLVVLCCVERHVL